MSLNNFAKDVLEAIPPIDSLHSKSEKALQKLTPGTWQYDMLSHNLKALKLAQVLLKPELKSSANLADIESYEALRALDSMITKTEKSKLKFAEGTSQHSLQKNRLNALLIARTLIEIELEKTD